MNETNADRSVFTTGLFTQKRAAKKLIDESRADTDFYLFLSIAMVLTTLGLLMDNAIVVVGAMLVAPILFPILALGLGIVTASGEAILRALRIIVISFIIGVAISFVVAFFVDTNATTEILSLLIESDLLLYFLISFGAGVVASFAWIKEDVGLSLPGVAIAVSLVPPLGAVGISLSLLSMSLFVSSVLLFIVNLLGVVLASIVVFSLFSFAQVRDYQDEKIKEEEEEKEHIKQEKKVEKLIEDKGLGI
ncbi:MAG: DUF389 domain-containing protein [Candidatus Paceibacterota bacterium]